MTPLEAEELLRKDPNLKDVFKQKYGYLPDWVMEPVGIGQGALESAKNTVAGTLGSVATGLVDKGLSFGVKMPLDIAEDASRAMTRGNPLIEAFDEAGVENPYTTARGALSAVQAPLHDVSEQLSPDVLNLDPVEAYQQGRLPEYIKHGLAYGAGQMALPVGASLKFGEAGANTALGLLSAASGGATYDEDERRRMEGEAFSRVASVGDALTAAGAEGVTERLGLDKITSVLRGALADVPADIRASALKRFLKAVPGGLATGASISSVEGLEEVVAQALQNFSGNVWTDSKTPLLEGAGKAAALGALGGATIGGPVGAAQIANAVAAPPKASSLPLAPGAPMEQPASPATTNRLLGVGPVGALGEAAPLEGMFPQVPPEPPAPPAGALEAEPQVQAPPQVEMPPQVEAPAPAPAPTIPVEFKDQHTLNFAAALDPERLAAVTQAIQTASPGAVVESVSPTSVSVRNVSQQPREDAVATLTGAVEMAGVPLNPAEPHSFGAPRPTQGQDASAIDVLSEGSAEPLTPDEVYEYQLLGDVANQTNDQSPVNLTSLVAKGLAVEDGDNVWLNDSGRRRYIELKARLSGQDTTGLFAEQPVTRSAVYERAINIDDDRVWSREGEEGGFVNLGKDKRETFSYKMQDGDEEGVRAALNPVSGIPAFREAVSALADGELKENRSFDLFSDGPDAPVMLNRRLANKKAVGKRRLSPARAAFRLRELVKPIEGETLSQAVARYTRTNISTWESATPFGRQEAVTAAIKGLLPNVVSVLRDEVLKKEGGSWTTQFKGGAPDVRERATFTSYLAMPTSPNHKIRTSEHGEGRAVERDPAFYYMRTSKNGSAIPDLGKQRAVDSALVALGRTSVLAQHGVNKSTNQDATDFWRLMGLKRNALIAQAESLRSNVDSPEGVATAIAALGKGAFDSAMELMSVTDGATRLAPRRNADTTSLIRAIARRLLANQDKEFMRMFVAAVDAAIESWSPTVDNPTVRRAVREALATPAGERSAPSAVAEQESRVGESAELAGGLSVEMQKMVLNAARNALDPHGRTLTFIGSVNELVSNKDLAALAADASVDDFSKTMHTNYGLTFWNGNFSDQPVNVYVLRPGDSVSNVISLLVHEHTHVILPAVLGPKRYGELVERFAKDRKDEVELIRRRLTQAYEANGLNRTVTTTEAIQEFIAYRMQEATQDMLKADPTGSFLSSDKPLRLRGDESWIQSLIEDFRGWLIKLLSGINGAEKVIAALESTSDARLLWVISDAMNTYRSESALLHRVKMNHASLNAIRLDMRASALENYIAAPMDGQRGVPEVGTVAAMKQKISEGTKRYTKKVNNKSVDMPAQVTPRELDWSGVFAFLDGLTVGQLAYAEGGVPFTPEQTAQIEGMAPDEKEAFLSAKVSPNTKIPKSLILEFVRKSGAYSTLYAHRGFHEQKAASAEYLKKERESREKRNLGLTKIRDAVEVVHREIQGLLNEFVANRNIGDEEERKNFYARFARGNSGRFVSSVDAFAVAVLNRPPFRFLDTNNETGIPANYWDNPRDDAPGIVDESQNDETTRAYEAAKEAEIVAMSEMAMEKTKPAEYWVTNVLSEEVREDFKNRAKALVDAGANENAPEVVALSREFEALYQAYLASDERKAIARQEAEVAFAKMERDHDEGRRDTITMARLRKAKNGARRFSVPKLHLRFEAHVTPGGEEMFRVKRMDSWPADWAWPEYGEGGVLFLERDHSTPAPAAVDSAVRIFFANEQNGMFSPRTSIERASRDLANAITDGMSASRPEFTERVRAVEPFVRELYEINNAGVTGESADALERRLSELVAETKSKLDWANTSLDLFNRKSDEELALEERVAQEEKSFPPYARAGAPLAKGQKNFSPSYSSHESYKTTTVAGYEERVLHFKNRGNAPHQMSGGHFQVDSSSTQIGWLRSYLMKSADGRWLPVAHERQSDMMQRARDDDVIGDRNLAALVQAKKDKLAAFDKENSVVSDEEVSALVEQMAQDKTRAIWEAISSRDAYISMRELSATLWALCRITSLMTSERSFSEAVGFMVGNDPLIGEGRPWSQPVKTFTSKMRALTSYLLDYPADAPETRDAIVEVKAAQAALVPHFTAPVLKRLVEAYSYERMKEVSSAVNDNLLDEEQSTNNFRNPIRNVGAEDGRAFFRLHTPTEEALTRMRDEALKGDDGDYSIRMRADRTVDGALFRGVAEALRTAVLRTIEREKARQNAELALAEMGDLTSPPLETFAMKDVLLVLKQAAEGLGDEDAVLKEALNKLSAIVDDVYSSMERSNFMTRKIPRERMLDVREDGKYGEVPTHDEVLTDESVAAKMLGKEGDFGARRIAEITARNELFSRERRTIERELFDVSNKVSPDDVMFLNDWHLAVFKWYITDLIARGEREVYSVWPDIAMQAPGYASEFEHLSITRVGLVNKGRTNEPFISEKQIREMKQKYQRLLAERRRLASIDVTKLPPARAAEVAKKMAANEKERKRIAGERGNLLRSIDQVVIRGGSYMHILPMSRLVSVLGEEDGNAVMRALSRGNDNVALVSPLGAFEPLSRNEYASRTDMAIMVASDLSYLPREARASKMISSATKKKAVAVRAKGYILAPGNAGGKAYTVKLPDGTSVYRDRTSLGLRENYTTQDRDFDKFMMQFEGAERLRTVAFTSDAKWVAGAPAPTYEEMDGIVVPFSSTIDGVSSWYVGIKDPAAPSRSDIERGLAKTPGGVRFTKASYAGDDGAFYIPLGKFDTEERAKEGARAWKRRIATGARIEDMLNSGQSLGVLRIVRGWKIPDSMVRAAEENGGIYLMANQSSIPPDLAPLLLKMRAPRKGTFAKRVRNAIDDFRQGAVQSMFDRLHGIKRAAQKVGTSLDGYMMARLSTGLASTIDAMMTAGPLMWRDKVVTINTDVPGLVETFKRLGPDPDMLRMWAAYLVGRRAKQLMAEGRENLFTEEEINTLTSLGERYPILDEVRRGHEAFRALMLQFWENSHIVSAENRKTWEGLDYIPFNRIADDETVMAVARSGGLANKPNPFHRLKGGRSSLADPVENLIRNYVVLTDFAIKNVAALEVVDSLLGTGLVTRAPLPPPMLSMAEVERQVTEAGIDWASLSVDAQNSLQQMYSAMKPAGNNIITVMRNGSREHYYVHDIPLFRSLTSINAKPMEGLAIDVLRGAKKTLTAGVTLAPGFPVVNWMRDALAVFVSGKEPTVPVVEGLLGAVQAFRKDEVAIRMMASGAHFGTGYINAGEPSSVKYVIEKHMRDQDFKNSILDTPWKLADVYVRVSAAAENAHRMALYRAHKRAGDTELKALYESKDIMDFSMRGESALIGFLVDTIPFFNPRLQGLYRLGRGAAFNPTAFAVKGLLVTLAAVALFLRYRDDERYRRLEDWDKDLYFHFWLGDEHYRIPKPFEQGAIFATIPERFIEASLTDLEKRDPDAASVAATRMWFMLSQTFNLIEMPQAVKPFYEVINNRDTFSGRPIVPMRLERLNPELMVTEHTSLTAKKASAAVPGFMPDLVRSPAGVDHLIRGYFGTLGEYALQMSDKLIREVENLPYPPTMRPDELPVIGRLARGPSTLPPKNTKYSTTFYEVLEEATKVHNSMSALYKEEDKRPWEALLYGDKFWWGGFREVNGRQWRLAYDRMKPVSTEVSKINAQIRDIQTSLLPPEMKREQIDALYERRNRLFEGVYEFRPGGNLNPPVKKKLAEDTIGSTVDVVNKFRENNMNAAATLFDTLNAPMGRSTYVTWQRIADHNKA
jgi:hypothetical protein